MVRCNGITEALFAAIVLMTSAVVQSREVTKQPHIILMLADDMGWNDPSFNGCPQIPTGSIDALAWNGIRLTQYYTLHLCTPSRAALMTGRYPIRTGMQHSVIGNEEPWGLPLNLKLLPEWLRDLEYINHIVGKWGLGFYKAAYTRTMRGFDHHFGFWGSAEDYYNHTAPKWPTDMKHRGLDFRNNFDILRNYTGCYGTEVITEEAVRIIMEHPVQKPLFLYVAHQAPHAGGMDSPQKVPRKYTEGFEYIGDVNRTKYAGMLKALDVSVGAIFEALGQKKMLENCVIAFSSDNGPDISAAVPNCASAWPLRGQKASLWEGGVRSAAFVWSPFLKVERFATWETSTASTTGTRWLVAPPRTELLINQDPIENCYAIREGNFKLISITSDRPRMDEWHPIPGNVKWGSNMVWGECYSSAVAKVLKATGRNLVCASSEEHCYAVSLECGKRDKNKECNASSSPCLFDLSKDPCEYNNIADDHPDVVKRLEEKMALYEAGAVAPAKRPPDPRSDPAIHGGVWTNWGDCYDIP